GGGERGGAAGAHRPPARLQRVDGGGPGDDRPLRRSDGRPPVDPRGRGAGQARDAGRAHHRARLPDLVAAAAAQREHLRHQEPQARGELRVEQGALHRAGALGLAGARAPHLEGDRIDGERVLAPGHRSDGGSGRQRAPGAGRRNPVAGVRV
ncbi:MAG: Acyl dehydratase, partial [uncultured Acetobacteraceae bacterium]